MLRGVIVEDNRCFREMLAGLLAAWGVEIVCCSETGRELEAVLGSCHLDVAFLDIGLPGRSGLELARLIRRKLPFCELVFITSHPEYIREAVELYAADYIVKPLDAARLKQTLGRIMHKADDAGRIVPVVTGEGRYFLREKDIYFVEANRNKVTIHCRQGTLEASHSLKEMEGKLGQDFFRSSRFYIVNLNRITAVKPYSRTSYGLQFADGKNATLSKKLYGEFRRRIKKISAERSV
ncbi:MAG TPA: LytTR family DNA-binding domain-containing protein [Bacillota bacterium]|nr:LytTR family DNA-binding domain-containing protein [Bacillota bacterium]